MAVREERTDGHDRERRSSHCQPERGRKGFWDAKQPDGHLPRGGNASIASQSFFPRKAIMRPLRTGKGRRRTREKGRGGRFDRDLDALRAHQLDACPAVRATTPVMPSDGLRADDHWMQQHADLARLLGGAALPLALLAQRTGTATAVTSSIHDAQAAVSALAAHGRQATALLDTGVSHRAGEESLAPRSDPFSRRWRWRVAHTQMRARVRRQSARRQAGWQEQTRSCGPDQDEADVPTPGAGSISIAPPLASTPDPRSSENTSDPGRSPDLHQPVQAQRPHDADTPRRHRRR
jgi:hypothetical protein